MSLPLIEHFFSAHSAFAWLGIRRLEAIAMERGRRIRHVPVPLDPLLEAAGAVPFRARPPGHVTHFFGREIARWSEIRGRPWIGRMPTHHHADYHLANRVLIAAEIAGHDPGPLAADMLTAHWEADADLSDRGALSGLLAARGLPDPLIAAADAPEAVQRHDANRDEAITRSVFGSPTYFVDGDMFYGQDRLDQVDRACLRPYAPTPQD